jgi:hypothetical protein
MWKCYTFDELAALANEIDDLEQIHTWLQNTAWLIRALQFDTVDQELLSLFKQVSERQLSILRERLNPYTRVTLEELAGHAGVTRERVRQIQVKGEKALTSALKSLPALRTRSAMYYAREAVPHGLSGVEDSLRQRGLIDTPEAFSDFIVLWRAAHEAFPFPDDLLSAARRGLSPAQIQVGKDIRHKATRLCRNCGAFRLEWLEADASAKDLRAALVSLGYEEIAPGWYWRDVTAKNVVEGVARKVFSVTHRITPRDFARSLQRHISRQGFPLPPANVLQEVVLRIGFVELKDGYLSSAQSFDPEAELEGSELVLYHYLATNGPVASFQELFEVNRDAGYAKVTLPVRLKNSPIIAKVGYGLYSLIGTEITQADIDAANARTARVQPHGRIDYCSDGSIKYSFNITSWVLYGGIVMDAQLAPFSGEWSTRHGKVVVNGKGYLRGLHPYVDELDLVLEDRVVISFDTWERAATVERVIDHG